jgi:preprotein translocase subunit SecD
VIPQASCRGYADLGTAQQQLLASALRRVDCAAAQTEPDITDRYYYACDRTGQVAYLLGHVIVPGRLISSASAQAPNVSQGQTDWTVALNLGAAGGNRWNAWTSKYHTDQSSAGNASPTSCGPSASLPCSDFVGFTLDGQVISAPVTEAILDQRTSISGNFTQTSANELARELNYGKLPVSFRADAVQNTSPTLGRSQLHAAFLAGGIGLLLVVLYSLIYYRALGLVTIASLIVSATLTYAMLVVLGKQLGYTLDLAGIAGFIVALGITADSFVVFFERLKDEVHEGRSPRVAVPRAWVRARRTILSADTVSFLAAAILYYFASADVKGFAFTLGMSTILDLVVVFLFTHPMVSLLSRSRTFSSARFTGLEAVRGSAPRASEPAAAAAAGGGAAAPTRRSGATAVAVLDRPEGAGSDDGGADDLTESEGPRVRNRTAPEPGSAAERAAARRARLRQQRDQDGGR